MNKNFKALKMVNKSKIKVSLIGINQIPIIDNEGRVIELLRKKI